MSSVIGARVVLGIAVAATAALAFMWWQWQSAAEDAAAYQQDAKEARQAAERNADRAQEIADERNRLDQIISEQRAEARQRRERLEQRVGDLQDAIQASECGRRDMPAAIRDRVRGTANGDGSANNSDDGAKKSD